MRTACSCVIYVLSISMFICYLSYTKTCFKRRASRACAGRTDR
jgi:uncharacterized membrane protein